MFYSTTGGSQSNSSIRYSFRLKLYVVLEKKIRKLYVVLQYQCNINVTFHIITLTIYYSLFLSILSFIFLILFIKDNFVKQLIISLFHTILIVFLNMCEMFKTSYNLERNEYWSSVNYRIFEDIYVFFIRFFFLHFQFHEIFPYSYIFFYDQQ